MSRNRTISDRAISVYDSEAFLSLQWREQSLYSHLCIRAYDDGAVGDINRVIFLLGYPYIAVKNLVESGFLIEFETGVVVIRHWFAINTPRADRYRPSGFEEMDMLSVNEKTKLYECRTRNPKNKDDREQNDPTDKHRYRVDKLFDRFYSAFPRHTHRGVAKMAYEKALYRGADPETLFDCAVSYANRCRSQKIAKNDIAHPSTWLNAGAWNDELQDNEKGGRTKKRLSSARADDYGAL